jgi:hypothetical protein
VGHAQATHENPCCDVLVKRPPIGPIFIGNDNQNSVPKVWDLLLASGRSGNRDWIVQGVDMGGS